MGPGKPGKFCEEGCQCKRHSYKGRFCTEDCTCKLHNPAPWTEERLKKHSSSHKGLKYPNRKKPISLMILTLEECYKICPNDCWEWLKAKDKFGYGRVGSLSVRLVGKHVSLAHRLSWILANGDLADDV